MYSNFRKRSRALFDDDSLEFMPLSKRINNLHINSTLPGNLPNNSQPIEQWGPGPPAQPQYQPELSVNQNPYYYTTNKLLFDLYIERMNRNGHQF